MSTTKVVGYVGKMWDPCEPESWKEFSALVKKLDPSCPIPDCEYPALSDPFYAVMDDAKLPDGLVIYWVSDCVGIGKPVVVKLPIPTALDGVDHVHFTEYEF